MIIFTILSIYRKNVYDVYVSISVSVMSFLVAFSFPLELTLNLEQYWISKWGVLEWMIVGLFVVILICIICQVFLSSKVKKYHEKRQMRLIARARPRNAYWTFYRWRSFQGSFAVITTFNCLTTILFLTSHQANQIALNIGIWALTLIL